MQEVFKVVRRIDEDTLVSVVAPPHLLVEYKEGEWASPPFAKTSLPFAKGRLLAFGSREEAKDFVRENYLNDLDGRVEIWRALAWGTPRKVEKILVLSYAKESEYLGFWKYGAWKRPYTYRSRRGAYWAITGAAPLGTLACLRIKLLKRV